MKIYIESPKSNQLNMWVQPGNEIKHVKDWFDEVGTPKMYRVNFINGMADLDNNVAQYLIDKGIAYKNPIMSIEQALRGVAHAHS